MHTPGPWEVGAFPLVGGHISISAGNYGIAKVWDQEEGSGFVNAANARLIAAAPDSHKANKAIVDDALEQPDGTFAISREVLEQVRAAIAKAAGAA